jgi:hypothetical protein
MSNSRFYGGTNQHNLSYLEYGTIDLSKGSKTVWDFRINQKAYDWLMLARYANDMAAYMDMIDTMENGSITNAIDIYRQEVYHADDFSVNLGKLIALSVASASPTPLVFFELGQTLFGCIEGMEFCGALLEKIPCNKELPALRDITWYGVDISRLFNRFAVKMHPGYSIETYEEAGELRAPISLFYAKGVTLLYAMRSIDALFELLDRCDAGLFDYSLSVNGSQEVVIGTGKTVRYLPLDDFVAAIRRRGKAMYVKNSNSHYSKETGRIFIDAVYGSPDYCENFIALDRCVRESIRGWIHNTADAELLLDSSKGRNSGWLALDDFITTCIPCKG